MFFATIERKPGRSNNVRKRGRASKAYEIATAMTEVIALDLTLEGENYIVLGIYRPPTNMGANYFGHLKDELSSVHSWALSHRHNIIMPGDINKDIGLNPMLAQTGRY